MGRSKITHHSCGPAPSVCGWYWYRARTTILFASESRRARSKLLRYRFCILPEFFFCHHRCRVGLMLRRARAGLLSCSFLAPYLAASRPHDDGVAFSPLSQRRLLGRCVLRTTVDTVLDRCVGLRCVNIALPSKVAPITRADVSHTLACVIDTGMCVHTHTTHP